MSIVLPAASLTATARPRPATPVAVLASSAALLALVGAAVAQRAPWLAGYLAVAALVPWARRRHRERLRGIGRLLAWVGLGWCAFEAARVPFGARVTALMLPGCAVFAARVWALGTEGVTRWAHARWSAGVTAPATAKPVEEAIAAALRAPAPRRAAMATPSAPSAAIDAAVAAIAAAPLDAVPAEEAARRAFWINVYNVLSAHAGRGRRSTRLLDVLEVSRTGYAVAGVRLTLDEIEHGLLRDGAPNPAAPWDRMSAADPRRRWAVPLDPRIHFALNCGALSCPPVRVYRGDERELDAQLAVATESFLQGESGIDEAAGVVETSRLLAWYARDFGGRRGVRAFLGRALGIDEARMAGMRLRYRRYDWTSSG